MGKITLNNDISKMFVGNDDVQAVYYGDILIYTALLYDRFIFNATTQTSNNTNEIRLSVTTGQESSCDVTFDGETITVPVNSTSYTCSFSRSSETTSNISIEGDFVNVTMSTGKLNYVDTWYKDQNFVFDVFRGFDGNANINFPSNIEDAENFQSNTLPIVLPINPPYTLSFTNNLKRIFKVNVTTSNSNVQLRDNYFYYINDVLINVIFPSENTTLTIPNNTRVICCAAFNDFFSGEGGHLRGINFPTDGLLKEIPPLLLTNNTTVTSVTIPLGVETIGRSAFGGASGLTSATISSSVSKIEERAFGDSTGSMNISNMTFNQPRDMTVSLPTPGSGSGFLYVKTARNMNIYTDNLIIKNYNYSADNITATLYHLDGTPW